MGFKTSSFEPHSIPFGLKNMLFYGIICHVRGFGNPVNIRKMRKTKDDKSTVRLPRQELWIMINMA